jgi:hypothetical protein
MRRRSVPKPSTAAGAGGSVEPEAGKRGLLFRRQCDHRSGAPQRIVRLVVRNQPVQLPANEAGIDPGVLEIVVKQAIAEEAGIGPHRPDLDPVEHGRERVDRLVAIGAAGDQLGDHRIVERRDCVALLHPGLDPSSITKVEMVEPSGAGQEAGGGILGIKPGFDRVPGDRQVLLAPRQWLAAGNAELPFDQVLAGDLFGDRMLDLQAGVHLHEPDAIGPQGPRCIGDELDRAPAPFVGFTGLSRARTAAPPDRLARSPRPCRAPGASSITFWWRRWSEQSRSNRRTTVPWRVAEHLHLDVPRALDPFFQRTTSMPKLDVPAPAACRARRQSRLLHSTLRIPCPAAPTA